MVKPKVVTAKSDPFITSPYPNAFHIWTDGSYRPEGNAAFAFVIYSQKTKHIVKLECQASRFSTINQMELQAINKALDFPGMDQIIIYSDSMYCISALTLWRKSWQRNNWMNHLGEPIKNKEIIEEICTKIDARKTVKFVKVKAHTGDPFNSLVDYLATNLTAKMRDKPNLPNGIYT